MNLVINVVEYSNAKLGRLGAFVNIHILHFVGMSIYVHFCFDHFTKTEGFLNHAFKFLDNDLLSFKLMAWSPRTCIKRRLLIISPAIIACLALGEGHTNRLLFLCVNLLSLSTTKLNPKLFAFDEMWNQVKPKPGYWISVIAVYLFN